jgi:predicted permease
MQALLKDIRYALRLLRRSPGFTAVALLSLGLGIGANTAIFSVVNAVVFRPMPVDAADRLVAVYQTDERNPGNIPVSDLNFQDLRDQNTVFEGMATVAFSQVNYLPDGGDSSQQAVQLVSGNYFDVMGVSLALGRGFRPEEDDAPGAYPVAVLSWPFWQREFGGAADVLGRTVTFNRTPFTVVGVAPRTFTGTFPVGAPVAWVPTAMHGVAQPAITWYEQRRGLFMLPVARLKSGTTVEQARSNLQAIMANLEREFPVDNTGRSAEVLPLLDARVDPNGNGQLVFLSRLLLVTVGIVLLIACANIANLLLARGSGRRRELAVRLALGADRGRLFRQLLTESVILSLCGGGAGLLLASWLTRLLMANPAVLPIPIEDVGVLDTRVLFFTAVVSVVTGLLFGLARSNRTRCPAARVAPSCAAPWSPRRWRCRSSRWSQLVCFCAASRRRSASSRASRPRRSPRSRSTWAARDTTRPEAFSSIGT